MVRAGAQGSGAAGQGCGWAPLGGQAGCWRCSAFPASPHTAAGAAPSQGSTPLGQHPAGAAPCQGSWAMRHTRGAQDPPAQPSPSPVSSWPACAGGRTWSAGTRGAQCWPLCLQTPGEEALVQLPAPAGGRAAAPQPYGTPLHHLCAACSGRSFAYGWVIRAVWWEQRMCRALVIQSVVLAENMFTTFPLLQHCPFQPAHPRLIHNCLGCLAGTMESMPLKWGWIGCQGSQEGHLMNRAQPLISLRSPGWREPPGWQKPWLKRRLNQGLACVTGTQEGRGDKLCSLGDYSCEGGSLGVMEQPPCPSCRDVPGCPHELAVVRPAAAFRHPGKDLGTLTCRQLGRGSPQNFSLPCPGGVP